jgi:HAD superfamily hydrolase (TIGR01509 family)
MFDEPVEAVIFDMDGLLIDTEAVYIKAHMAGAAIMGVELPLSFCHSMIGTPSPECDRLIQDFFGPAFRLDDFNGHVDGHAARLLEAGVPVKPGAVELLAILTERGLPLAVATSSSRRTTERHLGRAGLLGHFHALATRDDVVRGKPHPDIHLEAARRLGLAPERCLAFEDSNTGLTAAHAAGALAIMVPDIVPPTDDVRAKCLAVLPDLHAALDLLRTTLRPPSLVVVTKK